MKEREREWEREVHPYFVRNKIHSDYEHCSFHSLYSSLLFSFLFSTLLFSSLLVALSLSHLFYSVLIFPDLSSSLIFCSALFLSFSSFLLIRDSVQRGDHRWPPRLRAQPTVLHPHEQTAPAAPARKRRSEGSREEQGERPLQFQQ